jgi:hypothetical protein
LNEAGQIENRESLERRLARLRERQARGETTIEPMSTTTAPAVGGGDAIPIPALIMVIGGGAALVAWGIFAGLAAAEDGSLSSRCGRSCSVADVQTLNTFNIVADINLFVGLGAAAAGVVLWLVLPSGRPQHASVRWTPWATAQGGGLALGGQW